MRIRKMLAKFLKHNSHVDMAVEIFKVPKDFVLSVVWWHAIELEKEEMIANFLWNENHVSLAVKFLGVPE